MNPFGDDDEDFQTSDTLDYNLEVSYRCAFMDENSFPSRLSRTEKEPTEEADDENEGQLPKFLEEIDQELSELVIERSTSE
ncbi:unnamed protein product [Protopolystoma xenopodis]|uniref:Uncharacterized protein n=1 Tax=Protopolystoma xenopodis TaxID=117903 RepID=A0A448WDD9_9PLAT|nr:unnamed protein product [Protopolystoma xenopodis]